MNNYEDIVERITEFLRESEVYIKDEYLLPWSNEADSISQDLLDSLR